MLVALAVLAAPATASAACPATPLSQPFAAFGDQSQYTLVPGGGFEPGMTAWTLSGAQVAPGNETFFVGSTTDQYALQLPLKGVAVSPTFCVGPEQPTMRLFARQLTGKAGQLKVEILYPKGTSTMVMMGGMVKNTAGAYDAWNPSPILPLAAAVPQPTFGDGGAPLRLRLTADSGGTWAVDDVFYDPAMRG